MRNVLLLTINSLKITLRKRGTILVLLVLPIVSILLSMVLYKGAGTRTAEIGVINNDNSMISRQLVEAIGKEDRFKVVRIKRSELNSRITGGYLDCAITIPKDFSKSIYKGTAAGRISISSIKGYEVTGQIEAFANFYIRNLADIAEASGGDINTFNKIYAGFRKGALKFESNKLQDQYAKKSITIQSIGFLLIFLMFTAGNTAEFILKEKRDRTYYRISAAPVSSRTYIAGNVLTNLVIVFLQISVVLFTMTVIMKQETFIPAYQLLLVLMIFGMVAIGLGMVIVSFSKDTLQSNTLLNLVITPSCMLGGCFWPIEYMPGYMKKIADFMPQKWALDIISKLQAGKSIQDVLLSTGILLAFASALFLIAAYRFRKNNDVRSVV